VRLCVRRKNPVDVCREACTVTGRMTPETAWLNPGPQGLYLRIGRVEVVEYEVITTGTPLTFLPDFPHA